MEPIKFLIILLISFFTSRFSSAQTSFKTATVKVNGKCVMCKKHIETSARNAGARSASWDQTTKFLQISYDPSITNPIKIQTAIAGTGFDTEYVKANEINYQKLDECCRYDRMTLNETKE